MAFRLSASGTGRPSGSEGSRSSGMLSKMKDRAAAATAAGMAAASTAATKAAKTAKYGVSVAKDAAKDAFGTSFAPPERGERSERRSQGGAEVAEDEEEMELQRALAASMKTAQQERSRGPQPDPPGLQTLLEMGFEEDVARQALQAANGNLEAALAQLVSAPRSSPRGEVLQGRPVPSRGAREAALQAAEQRLAQAQERNAGTMEDWRRYKQLQQEQERKERRRAAAVAAPATATGDATAVEAAAVEKAAEAEELMLQEALAASMKSLGDSDGNKVDLSLEDQVDPELFELRLQQAIAEEELELQLALSASLDASRDVEADPSCAGAAVGEEAAAWTATVEASDGVGCVASG
ncbi:unnamed protein product [Durusdinium trenchii]|uniref:UBA domain-containing protein n=1 Tax=Durusdinium trenchii TaxID=1381693 RepID=A0ABP0ITM3_9DINO